MGFNMKLKYVGDMPLISQHGVSFDHMQPDRYKFLQATVELLEALSYGPSETTQHLYKIEHRELTPSRLMDLIHKHIPNIDIAFESSDKKAHDLIHDLVNRVNDNDALSADEKTAWLENIKIMRAYYYQYVINKSAYEAALEALGDEIAEGRIEEVTVPVIKNYGVVLNDLVSVLEQRKVPIEAKIKIELNGKDLVAKLTMNYS